MLCLADIWGLGASVSINQNWMLRCVSMRDALVKVSVGPTYLADEFSSCSEGNL